MKKRENSLLFALVGLMGMMVFAGIKAASVGGNSALPQSANSAAAQVQNNKEQCAICLSTIEEHPAIQRTQKITLSCKHTFHYICLLPWQQKENTCPNCRAIEPLVTAPAQIKKLNAEIEALNSKLSAATTHSQAQSQSAAQSSAWSEVFRLPKWFIFYVAHHWGHKDKRGQELAYLMQVLDSIATVDPHALKSITKFELPNVFKGGFANAGLAVGKSLGTYGMYNAVACLSNYIEGKPVKPEDFHAGIATFAKAMAATMVAERSYTFYKLSREEKKRWLFKAVLTGLGIGGIAYAVKKYGVAASIQAVKDITSQVLSYVGNKAVDVIC